MANPTNGDSYEDYNFWTARFLDQLTYLEDLVARYKSGVIDLARFTEVGHSALDRMRYIQQQRVWILEEIQNETEQ